MSSMSRMRDLFEHTEWEDECGGHGFAEIWEIGKNEIEDKESGCIKYLIGVARRLVMYRDTRVAVSNRREGKIGNGG